MCAYYFNIEGVINKMYVHTVLIWRWSSIRYMCMLFQNRDVCAYCFNMAEVINKMYVHTVLI